MALKAHSPVRSRVSGFKVSTAERSGGGRREDFQDAIQPYMNSTPTLTSIQRLCASAFSKTKSNMIRVNLNGTVFILSRGTAVKIPALQAMLPSIKYARSQKATKGSLLWSVLSGSRDELFFERNATIFAAVVDFVQNGELHAPHDICPKFFARELNFWGFDIEVLEPCCFAGVVHFLYEQERLSRFHGFLHHKTSATTLLPCRGELSASKSETEENDSCLQKFMAFRWRVWTVLDEPFSGRVALVYFWAMSIIILASIFTIAAGTHEFFQERHGNTTKASNNHTIVSASLFYTEQTCLTLLYFDYIFRLFFYPWPLYFLCDVINVTDGLATLSNLVQLLSQTSGLLPQNEEGQMYLDIVDMIQMLRILRLFRPMSKLTGFRLIYYTVKCSFRELLLVLMLLIFLAMFFSSLLYYLGDGRSIRSIPDAMWFSVITMTTVGYGDIVPRDWRTMLIGSVVAVFGVIMMSMTTPIMVSNFHSLYLNAVVGQPNTIKKAYKLLDKGSSESVSKKSSTLFEAPWRRFSKVWGAEAPRDTGGSPEASGVVGPSVQKARSAIQVTRRRCRACCTCCRKSRPEVGPDIDEGTEPPGPPRPPAINLHETRSLSPHSPPEINLLQAPSRSQSLQSGGSQSQSPRDSVSSDGFDADGEEEEEGVAAA